MNGIPVIEAPSGPVVGDKILGTHHHVNAVMCLDDGTVIGGCWNGPTLLAVTVAGPLAEQIRNQPGTAIRQITDAVKNWPR